MRRIIRIGAVMDATGLGRATIYRLAAEGKFPSPVKITDKASGWFEDEVAEWQERKDKERDGHK